MVFRFALIVVALCASYFFPPYAEARDNQSVRIIHNEDGSYTKFKKSPDDRVIERLTYGSKSTGTGERVLYLRIVYRKDRQGRFRSGMIYDGAGNILYRVVYGYHRLTGRLVAENMYDARVKRTHVITDRATGKPKEIEKPVRYLRYRYDAQGRQMKPIVFCLPAGRRAEELFGKEGSSYMEDPWKKGR